MVSVDFCICGGYKSEKVRCVECGRIIEDFDEFAPFYECDVCRRNPLIKKEELKIGGKNMVKYKKLKIKNDEDVEEIDIDDIEELSYFPDVHFKHREEPNSAMTHAYYNNTLQSKTAKLSTEVDWIIREYHDNLYLIALKKDC